MKSLTSFITISLMLATGAVLAHEPAKGAAPPAATPQAMDHGKMGMQKDRMDHSKMGMCGMNAADHQKMAMEQFVKLDSNNDGNLSKAEFAKHHAMMCMQPGMMDHGKMGMSGMKPADHQKMAKEEFAKLDSNKDGKLVKGEIAAGHPLAAHFGMLDTNKDGSLSQAEFAKHHGM